MFNNSIDSVMILSGPTSQLQLSGYQRSQVGVCTLTQIYLHYSHSKINMGNDNQSPKYCMECGAELPDRGSFCPECGTETDLDSNNASGESDGSSQEELLREAEMLRDKSRGGFFPRVLTQIEAPNQLLDGARSDGRKMLYEDPLITYFKEDEQPHYLAINPITGLRIIDPSGNEKTPHHKKGRDKFLIATDERILYIAACEGEDKVREFSYNKIDKAGITNRNDLTTQAGLASKKIGFHTTDGYEYKFADGSVRLDVEWNAEGMADYIKERANAEDIDFQQRMEDKAKDFFSL